MSYTEALTRYTANFIDQLAASGLRDVVISPGSRSTPLAVLCAEHDQIKDWIVVDERSAAYFALGIAQASKRPVALVCTSGTAAANYLPAVVEAFYARVPLIVLTADRPHELRDIGASQTINQIGMYHDFVKQFYEMAPPSERKDMLAYVRNRALRTVKIARADNPGPVHVNFPFQEPLMPDVTLKDLWSQNTPTELAPVFSSKKRLPAEQISKLTKFMSEHPKGLLVCGPQTDSTLKTALFRLSEKLGVPILADPFSQLRTGQAVNDHLIATYDSLFRSEDVRASLKPDYILRFGAMPISKHYSFFVEEHKDIPQFVVENHDSVREPMNHEGHYIIADGATLCHDLRENIQAKDDRNSQDWLSMWQEVDQTASEILKNTTAPSLTEGTAVREIIAQLEAKDHLFVANSMPVRDVDTFLLPMEKEITLYANRGVSGIDGTLSSAIGVATKQEHVTLIIGDLSFYHDLNSLLIAKRYEVPMTIVLINNNGGGIFSFLPQAEDERYFEHLFGTPLDINFKHAITMYGGGYQTVETTEQLTSALQAARQENSFNVIEIQTDRTENVNWHRQVWENITKRLEHNDTL